MQMVDGFPRRNRVDLHTPAELAIRNAVLAVEEAGCDVLLTDAVTLLGQAKDKVADFVEKAEPAPQPVAPPPAERPRCILCGSIIELGALKYGGNDDSKPIHNGLIYCVRSLQAQREKAEALARAVLDKENWFPSLPCVQLQDMARAYLKAGGEGEDGRV